MQKTMHKLSVPRGTQDVLPDGWRIRYHILDTVRSIFGRTGFERIMTPTFEETALFTRGVGESTDIVGKEMYTFTDRSDRSLTLRPEGTAPVARAFISEGMHREPLPVKLWYFAPMFRYEAPQKGRYREHYQIGAEAFGSPLPAVDAELITMLHTLYTELRVPDVVLRLNSIGDEQCRPAFRDELVRFLRQEEGGLCDDCRARIDTNPLRTFDCKQQACREIMQRAPRTVDHLCDDCREHFDGLRELLAAAGVPYTLDPTLVRGLDYYTRTTFEFACSRLGAQDAIGGGGRFDRLVETLGGPATPAVGFGCGIERVIIAMEAGGVEAPPRQVDVYTVVGDESRRAELFALAQRLRMEGYVVEGDLMGRSTKGQLKQASKLGARLALIADAEGLRIYALQGREEWQTTPDTAVNDIAERMTQQ